MDHHTSTNTNTTEAVKAEALRLLSTSEKLLNAGDLTGSREFALLSQESDPFLEGSDQILAITDVLLASETRVVNNRHHDWYAILQTDPHLLLSDPDLLKKNYRRLALLLHPDKNPYPLAASAFKLVSDAWSVLSDTPRKERYDQELNGYQSPKLPVRKNTSPTPNPAPQSWSGTGPRSQTRSAGRGSEEGRNFWTACPYCYVLYEYPRIYEDCCLKCQSCERGYHASVINSIPTLVPGKEAYYCCWGFFPLGFSPENIAKGKNKVGSDNNNARNFNPNSVFPNWMPGGMFTTPVEATAAPPGAGGGGKSNVSAGFTSAPSRKGTQGKKRGRPRKNP